jgi:hypothetical protein
MASLAEGGHAAVILQPIIAYVKVLVKQKIFFCYFHMPIIKVFLETMPCSNTSKSP